MTSIPQLPLSILAECEKELILAPGRIQPFGVLLTIEPELLTIQNISENCLKLWDRHSFALLGRSLGDFITKEAQEALRKRIEETEMQGLAPLRLTLTFDEYIKRDWDIRIHRHHGVLYLEYEPVSRAGSQAGDEERHLRIRQAISAMQEAETLPHLCAEAANQIRSLTGFGRVMVCRFDEEGRGKIVAESCDASMDSCLGLQVPSAAMPPQTRAMLLQTAFCMIPDADYTPARVYPNAHPQSGEALDLSRGMLRSVSPVHLESLRSMKIKASLTISLIDAGKLWGLIACHHHSPLLVDFNLRNAVQAIGQLVSAQASIQ